MADAIITSVLNIVSALCNFSSSNSCRYLLDLQENKDALHTAMEELKATRDGVTIRVDEAENNQSQKCTPTVDSWLKRVQTVEDEVVQVIQKADQEIHGRCFGCPKNCWNASKIGKRVIQRLSIVNDLKNKGDLFVEVCYNLPIPLVQKEAVDLTVGMDSKFEKVWRWLANDEIRIMGLYGCGGVGKTTLLKQINNEFLKSTTHVVILVVVSKEINIDVIQKEIGNRLGLSSPNEKNIRNALSKKNFLLLLDDIWERVDLQRIGVPCPPENKSKILFTTRSETVCGLMEANRMLKVEGLPQKEAWSLFKEKVGFVALNSNSKVPDLAEVVARECGGLPLALITIGRAMSTKKTVQEWNHAITTLRRAASEFPGMGDTVLPRLKLSYDYLPNDTIKSCFLYCAVYPEDHSIEKSQLIDYWIGEGFILLSNFNHIDEARNYGYHIIGILQSVCLLESGEKEETQVKMHDVIRDLALWIACKRLISGALDDTPEKWYNANRIFWMPSIRRNETEVSPLKSPNLLTLIICSTWRQRSSALIVPQNFFQFTPLLRVLDLSGSKMGTFPTSITELLELQYLNLSYTNIQVIPKELRKLVKLNYLDLSCNIWLNEIPSGVIGSLLELRILNLWGCAEADCNIIEELYNLKHLNYLGITIKIQHTLTKFIQYSSCSFQNLSQIDIWDCNAVKDLNWVGYLGNLKTLSVLRCQELEEIVMVADDFEGSRGRGDEISTSKMTNNVEDIFKRLEKLTILGLPKLKSICSKALAFPCLVSMHVRFCSQLKKLPFDSRSNVNNTLQKIEGDPNWWSGLQWEEDHENNKVKSKFLPYFVDCDRH